MKCSLNSANLYLCFRLSISFSFSDPNSGGDGDLDRVPPLFHPLHVESGRLDRPAFFSDISVFATSISESGSAV